MHKVRDVEVVEDVQNVPCAVFLQLGLSRMSIAEGSRVEKRISTMWMLFIFLIVENGKASPEQRVATWSLNVN